MTQSQDYDLTFMWLAAGADRPRKTVVKVTASSQRLAIAVALRAIGLDNSIPIDATIRSIKL